MKKISVIVEELKTKKADLAELEAKIKAETIGSIKQMLEMGKTNLLKTIATLEADMKAQEAAAEILDKDWTQVCKEYPLIAQAYKDTMSISSGISINTPLFHNAKRLASIGKLSSVLLYGPTGTGKTTWFRALGNQVNRPVMSVNASNGMKEEDLFGSYIVGKDGKVVFTEGPLLVAMKTGAILVIEEINGAKPSVMLKLNSVLDDLGQVYVKETGETFKAHPLFMLGGTFNPGYAGTRKMNKALVNRFQIVSDINEMTEPQLRSAVLHKIPDATEEELKVGWSVFKGVLNVLQHDELDGAISVRQIVSMISYYRGYNNERDNKAVQRSWTPAINNAVKGQVSGGDEDIANKVKLVAEDIKNKMDKDGTLKDPTPTGDKLADISSIADKLKKAKEAAEEEEK